MMPMPMPMPMPLEMSIAVGGGYAFLGSTNLVENALRSVANPKDAKAARTEYGATSHLSQKDVSSWGYLDIRKSIEIQTAMSNKMAESMFEEMEAFDPEMAAEMKSEFEQQSAMQNKIVETITSLLGPMAWDLTADDTGLTAHAVMLTPAMD
jgi:hypothetical protein